MITATWRDPARGPASRLGGPTGGRPTARGPALGGTGTAKSDVQRLQQAGGQFPGGVGQRCRRRERLRDHHLSGPGTEDRCGIFGVGTNTAAGLAVDGIKGLGRQGKGLGRRCVQQIAERARGQFEIMPTRPEFPGDGVDQQPDRALHPVIVDPFLDRRCHVFHELAPNDRYPFRSYGHG